MSSRFHYFKRNVLSVALLIRVSVVALLSLGMVSCQKGDTGPAGATGAAGAAGATGTTGAQGPAGTANVIYSGWFTPPAYTKDTVFGIYQFYYNEIAPAITQGVLDSGLVITFGQLDGYVTSIWPTDQVAALPITITYMEGSTTYTDTWSALDSTGNLQIQFVDNLNLYGGISNAHKFRYVIIPGGASLNATSENPGLKSGNGSLQTSSSVREVIQNYRQMSYAEICGRLGIPE
jgi:hypothetical protein